MYDLTAFERQVADEARRMAGPSEPVDDAALFGAVRSAQSPGWRIGSFFSAAKLAAAGGLVVLVGALVVSGVLPPTPGSAPAPGAVGSQGPAMSADPAPTASPRAALETYESTATLVVDPGPDPSVGDLAGAERAALRYAQQAESPSVAEAVIEKLKLDDSPGDLLERVSTEASTDALILSISVRDSDAQAARTLANAYGDEMVRRVRNSLITPEIRAADDAIARNEASIRQLANRLQVLRRKPNKDEFDRSEIISITGQISALQSAIQSYQPNSRAYVRNRLDWLERPTVPERSVDEAAMDIPRREVVVATQPIPRGALLEPGMLALRAVPLDVSNDKALTDTADAIGKVAAIEILVNQVVLPNMLLATE